MSHLTFRIAQSRQGLTSQWVAHSTLPHVADLGKCLNWPRVQFYKYIEIGITFRHTVCCLHFLATRTIKRNNAVAITGNVAMQCNLLCSVCRYTVFIRPCLYCSPYVSWNKHDSISSRNYLLLCSNEYNSFGRNLLTGYFGIICIHWCGMFFHPLLFCGKQNSKGVVRNDVYGGWGR